MPATNLFFPVGYSEPVSENGYPIDDQTWDRLAKWYSRVHEWHLDYHDFELTLNRDGSVIEPTDRVLSETDIPCKVSTPFGDHVDDEDPELSGMTGLLSVVANGGLGGGLLYFPYIPASDYTWTEAAAGVGHWKPYLSILVNAEFTDLGPLSFASYNLGDGSFPMHFTFDGLSFDGTYYAGGAEIDEPDTHVTISPVLYWSHGGKYDTATGALL